MKPFYGRALKLSVLIAVAGWALYYWRTIVFLTMVLLYTAWHSVFD